MMLQGHTVQVTAQTGFLLSGSLHTQRFCLGFSRSDHPDLLHTSGDMPDHVRRVADTIQCRDVDHVDLIDPSHTMTATDRGIPCHTIGMDFEELNSDLCSRTAVGSTKEQQMSKPRTRDIDLQQ
jgi:hypothetical protein